MASDPQQRTVEILKELSLGDRAAVDELLPLVYDQLKALANRRFRNQPADATLQPTALVHEAYMKLVDRTSAGYESKTHFLGVAAKAMRHILIDRARRRASVKHGGNVGRITLDEALVPGKESEVDILELDAVLEQLSELDERKGQVVELRFFGGLSIEETAKLLGVARSTVAEDWRFAKAWLASELADRNSSER